ncbi:MAG: RluA family pseudouridine synthase [Candidatus Omnitrophota bacterium]
MKKYEFTAGAADSGSRLDVFLVERLNHKESRSFVKKIIDNAGVLVNGTHHKAHFTMHEGDRVCIEIPSPLPVVMRPENIPITIVYEDEDLIVLNKQAGLVVHPAPGHYTGTLINALLYHCKNLSGIGGVIRPGLVHRLDKDTSGLMVVAKTDTAHQSLAGQFKSRKARREYVALVRGIVQLDTGVVELPIGRSPFDRKRMDVSFTNSREARTTYHVVKRYRDFTMVRLTLDTGRTHQIRVHMAHIGHPVVGDATYGSRKGSDRQALHAKSLFFRHPVTKEEMGFDSDMPADMAEILKRGSL